MKALGKHINGKHGEGAENNFAFPRKKSWKDVDVVKAAQCGGDMKGQSLIEYYTTEGFSYKEWRAQSAIISWVANQNILRVNVEIIF